MRVGKLSVAVKSLRLKSWSNTQYEKALDQPLGFPRRLGMGGRSEPLHPMKNPFLSLQDRREGGGEAESSGRTGYLKGVGLG